MAPWIRDYARDYAERELGARLHIGEIGGSWTGDLALTDVRWDSERSPLRHFTADLSAEYSLWAWLTGEDDWIQWIDLDVSGVEIVLPDATEAEPAPAGEPPDIALGIDALALRIENLLVRNEARDWAVDVDRIQGAASLHDGVVDVDELRIETSTNELVLTGGRADLAAGSWNDVLRRSRGELSVQVDDLASLDPFRDPASIPPHRIEIRASLEDGIAGLSGAIVTEGGRFDLKRGALTLASGVDPLDDAELDLEVAVTCDDVEPLARLAEVDVSGALRGDLSLRGKWRAPLGRLVATAEDLSIEGRQVSSAEIDLESNGVWVTVTRLDAVGPSFSGSCQGRVHLEPLRLEKVAVDLRSPVPGLLFPGIPTLDELSLKATVDGPLASLSGPFEASGEALELNGTRLADEIRVQGDLVEGALVNVAELELALNGDLARASGSWRRLADGSQEVSVSELIAEAAGIECFLVAPIDFTIAPDEIVVRGLQLGTDTGTARIDLAWVDSELALAVDVDDFDPLPVVGPFLPAGMNPGSLGGRVEGTVSEDRADLRCRLGVDGLTLGTDRPPWNLEIDAELADERLSITRFEGTSAGGSSLTANGSAPFDPWRPTDFLPGDLNVVLRAEAVDLALVNPWVETDLAGDVSISANVEGPWERLVGNASAQVERLELPSLADHVAGPAAISLDLRLDDAIVLERLELEADRGRLFGTGSLGLTPDLPRILADPEALQGSPLSFRCEVDLGDVGWAAEELVGIRRFGGKVTGRLAFGGTVGEPTWEGSLELFDGDMRLARSMPPVHDVSAHLAFDGRSIRVQGLRGEIGGAPLLVSGTIDLSGETPTFDLSFSGENLLLQRSTELRIRADANLSVSGPIDQLLLSGEVALTEGRYARNIDLVRGLFEGSSPRGARGMTFGFAHEPPLSSMKVDVKVRSKDDFVFDTNLVRAWLRPELHVGGTAEVLIPLGPVFVGESRVSLPSGRLYIRSGTLEFKQENPFVPEVTLNGDMRALGYEVDVRVTGPYDNPEIALSSIPPLDNDELIALVLTGRLPSVSAGEWRQQAVESVAIFVTRDALARFLFDRHAEPGDSLLDRFELEPGTNTTESGAPTGKAFFYIDPRPRREGRAAYLAAQYDQWERINYGLGLLFRFR